MFCGQTRAELYVSEEIKLSTKRRRPIAGSGYRAFAFNTTSTQKTGRILKTTQRLDQFKQIVESIVTVPASEWERIVGLSGKRNLKRAVIWSVPASCKKLLFYKKGLVRFFCSTEDGKESNKHFAMKNGKWFCRFFSFTCFKRAVWIFYSSSQENRNDRIAQPCIHYASL